MVAAKPDTIKMPMTAPMILTLIRIALIPVLLLVFYLPFSWTNTASMVVFVSAALTDWLDGYLARKMGLLTSFGAFLDPVADKLMVATALVLLVQRPPELFLHPVVFTIAAAIIIGREIAISALREWMAEMGEGGRVTVSGIGKLKTIFQMTAISFLLFRQDLFGLPIELAGEFLLYAAAGLTLWSMWVYLHSAWPVMMKDRGSEDS
ncbi:MAG: CDP-diacylglycerol--glycerol-3-phosphate 3-phosphatidyltransferase [Lysobacterales bacterium]|jgi:CDP-diacylglycerol--glycerol-3-phosphate 3-phosphatidyltransferase